MLVVFLASATLAGSSYAKGAWAVDGDSLTQNGAMIRLWGIDAPELHQVCMKGNTPYECGQQAKGYLISLIRAGNVECQTVDTDKYGRLVSRCAVNGQDLGTSMVLAGWAIDYKRYSNGYYSDQELTAKQNGAGIWAGTFIQPEAWRKKYSHSSNPVYDGVK